MKSPWGGQQGYYPTPPKTFVPNLDKRDDNKLFSDYTGNMQISARTANAARNVEREQWQTTYDLTHTGLGPANPKSLDNLDEKEHRKRTVGTGKDEDDLVRDLLFRCDPLPHNEALVTDTEKTGCTITLTCKSHETSTLVNNENSPACFYLSSRGPSMKYVRI